MQIKKNPKIDLEKYRTHFFLIGLALSILAMIGLFNINFSEEKPEPKKVIIVDSDDIVVPITIRPPQKTTQEAPKDLPTKLDIIDDHLEVENELDMRATETDENEFLLNDNQDVQYVDGEVEVIEQEAEVLEELEDPIPFAVVESVPVFPGCDAQASNDEKKECFQRQLLRYVSENFVYSEAARQLKIQGRVIVQFVVEKNGQISNVELLRKVDPWLDEEALRVIRSLPAIQPASQRGKPVRMSFVVPIKIELKE